MIITQSGIGEVHNNMFRTVVLNESRYNYTLIASLD